MALKTTKDSNSVFKSVFVAYFILILHVLLIAGLGMLVIFFRGIIQYMFWIFLAGTAIILLSAYRFYKRMKKERKSLQEMLALPDFQGRSVEVSVLGGFATIKLGQSTDSHQTLALNDKTNSQHIKQLESGETLHVKELNQLARLLENNLITKEEFNKAKKQLFDS